MARLRGTPSVPRNVEYFSRVNVRRELTRKIIKYRASKKPKMLFYKFVTLAGITKYFFKHHILLHRISACKLYPKFKRYIKSYKTGLII